MAISDITDPAAVADAIAEFDQLGRDSFLAKYRFARAREYYLVVDGQFYDSKAILGAAHGLQHEGLGPLDRSQFSGGAQTVARLHALGYKTVRLAPFLVTPSGRTFGHVPGSPPSSGFASRAELSASGVHKPRQAGISSSASAGADSIVVSGGYEDDEDFGHTIVYTGHGGNDAATKRQIADQELARGNLGLATSCDEGLPLRVVRGASGDPAFSPSTGFRYDGLFTVESYWSTVGRSGFRIYQYRLVATEPSLSGAELDPIAAPAPRSEVITQRIIRNTAVAQRVKQLHGHRCQVCGLLLVTPSGPYAEGAHIRALGRPHDGPDVEENVLCLCPNHHVLFDKGALTIDDDLTVRSTIEDTILGRLRSVPGHVAAPVHLQHHREHFRG